MTDILQTVLTKNISDVEVYNDGVKSLIDDFPNKKLITEYTDLRFLQLTLARRAIIEKSSYLGDQLKSGYYVSEEGSLKSTWEIYALNDGSGKVGVLWSHSDDDSWSVFFTGDNLELAHLYYEN